MWLVTIEDGDGMWWDEPVAADTKAEAVDISRSSYPFVPEGYCRVLYKCEAVDTLDHGMVRVSQENADAQAKPGN